MPTFIDGKRSRGEGDGRTVWLGIRAATRQPLGPPGTQVNAPASMRTTLGLGNEFLHQPLPSAWPHPTRRQDASACRTGAPGIAWLLASPRGHPRTIPSSPAVASPGAVVLRRA